MGLGMGEIIMILIAFGAIGVSFYFIVTKAIEKGSKTCPHCAERIQKAAKVCRYCQRDVANVEIENKPPRGLFQ
jgi:hypothetical protein